MVDIHFSSGSIIGKWRYHSTYKTMDRLQQLHDWVRAELAADHFTLQPISGDASFRRYYRLALAGRTYVVMHAPPRHENNHAFLAVNRCLAQARLNVPKIFSSDLERGFLILSDLGDTLYIARLEAQSVDALYHDAMTSLLHMQMRCRTDDLPRYDAHLLRQEIRLFVDWLLGRHLAIPYDSALAQALEPVFDCLIDAALTQPQVFVHRDYHSKNLIYTKQYNPGILDYQDAVCGPLTYDLVSLLKDCYIKWPRSQVYQWVMQYHQRLLSSRHIAVGDRTEFLRCFDLMGVQRHLKASGIFARLFHRDNKRHYLAYIPRTLSYIVDLEAEYEELSGLCALIKTRVLPVLDGGSR